MTRMDSTRLAKNFGYMARTLNGRPEEQYEDAAKAVLEHHFDSHEYCGDWCKRKNETLQQRKTSGKYYRCKKSDAKLYLVLQEKLARFLSKDKLIEMAHGLDTNMNEAFNNICTWFSPKNKVYAGAYSLNNRIAFAVGINSVGVLVYFKRLFRKLGIQMTDNVEHYLRIKEKTRMKRLENVKTKEAKHKKSKRKRDKLVDDTKTAKMELRKRLGTYRRGMALDDVVDHDEVPIAKKRKATKKAPSYCEWCRRLDHATNKNKKCKAPPNAMKKYRKDGSLLTDPPLAALDEETVEEEEDPMLATGLPTNDIDDCDDFDHQPLVHMPGEEGFDEDLFLAEAANEDGTNDSAVADSRPL
jgi:hypothetical protein